MTTEKTQVQKIFNTESTMKNHKYWLLILVLSALSSSVLLIASMQEAKWLTATVLGLGMIYTCLILQRKLWHLLIFSAVFFIPLRIDFYLFLKPAYIVQSYGLPVSAFDLLLFVLVFYWVFQILTHKEKFNFYPSVSIPALIYILLSGLSALQSADRLNSFLVFVFMVKLYVVFIYFANKIKTQKEMLYVIFALISCVLFQSLVGGIQYVTGSLLGIFGEPTTAFKTTLTGLESLSRVGGTIGHPNGLAKYLNLCLPVLLCAIFIRFNTVVRLLACLSFILGGFTEILTFSRGGWLALGIVLILTLYEIIRYRSKSRPTSIIFATLLFLFLFGITMVVSDNFRNRLFKDDFGSAKSRIPMAQVALSIIKDKPLRGVGLNNYATVMHAYDRTRNAQTYKFPHPVHNSYLLIAAESGIPALAAFLWLIAAIFNKARTTLKFNASSFSLLQVGWIGGLLTWLISGMFDRDFAGTNVMLWFTFAMVMASDRILFIENKKEIGYETKGFSHRT